MTNLAGIDRPMASQVSHYQRIIAFRTPWIYGYTDVDDRLVWDVIKTNLPILAVKFMPYYCSSADRDAAAGHSYEKPA